MEKRAISARSLTRKKTFVLLIFVIEIPKINIMLRVLYMIILAPRL